MPPLPAALGRQFLPEMLDNLYDGVYMLDREMRVVLWNRAAQRLTGCRPEEILGRHCAGMLDHCLADGTILCESGCPMRKAMTDGSSIETTVYLQHRDGSRLPVAVRICPAHGDGGEIIGAIQVFSDDTSRALAVRRLNQLENLAANDTLTGISNRPFLEEQLGLRIEEARRTGRPVGCIFLDVDHFKSINDRHGHDTGDAALRIIGRTLAANTRSSDVVGRWGGEEFLVLTMDTSAQQTLAIAHSLCELIRCCRLETSGGRIPLTASFGATVSSATDTPGSLVERADRLMYQSKKEGRNRVTSDAGIRLNDGVA